METLTADRAALVDGIQADVIAIGVRADWVNRHVTACMDAYIHACVHNYMPASKQTEAFMHTHLCACMPTYVRIHKHACPHIRLHAHTQVDTAA